MMRIVIVTIFPGMFDSPFAYGMVKRAQQKGLVENGVETGAHIQGGRGSASFD